MACPLPPNMKDGRRTGRTAGPAQSSVSKHDSIFCLGSFHGANRHPHCVPHRPIFMGRGLEMARRSAGRPILARGRLPCGAPHDIMGSRSLANLARRGSEAAAIAICCNVFRHNRQCSASGARKNPSPVGHFPLEMMHWPRLDFSAFEACPGPGLDSTCQHCSIVASKVAWRNPFCKQMMRPTAP